LPEQIPTPELRLAVAFVAVFIATLVVTTQLGHVLYKLVRAIGLESLDRVLGAAFGVAKAGLIVVALALLLGLTRAPQQPFWRDSVSGPPLARLALAFKPALPPAFAERLRYD
jgi:membrane protein required for colicin V production